MYNWKFCFISNCSSIHFFPSHIFYSSAMTLFITNEFVHLTWNVFQAFQVSTYLWKSSCDPCRSVPPTTSSSSSPILMPCIEHTRKAISSSLQLLSRFSILVFQFILVHCIGKNGNNFCSFLIICISCHCFYQVLKKKVQLQGTCVNFSIKIQLTYLSY